jgi:diguanylate cyclase (GGDEF)-like protein
MNALFCSDKTFTVLIVDDDVTNLDILSNILNPHYTVRVAKSGEGALEQVRSGGVDLMLLDVVMPGKNGFEVLTELKNSEEGKNIPVIFVTGLAETADEEKGFELGAVDYITKPVHAGIVRARVRNQEKLLKSLRTLEKLGLMDPLTGLANRRSFDHQLQMEWNRAVREKQTLSFLMLDIDHFKTFNDTYGHPQGDVLLQSLAKVLFGGARRPADLVARMGGEEFGVLLPNTEPEGAAVTAEKIRASVEAMVVSGLPTATVSVGVASVKPALDGIPAALVENADKALYQAKETGRNRVCVAS